ncbi:MAG: type II secretion system protein GspL [Deltaproteobacteria bacterium]
MLSLGIDIRSDHAVLSLVARTGRTLALRKNWRVEGKVGGELAAALRESLARECPEGPGAVATALPGASVSHRILQLPFPDAAKLRATIPFELESEVPFDLEDSVVAWNVLHRNGPKTTVLAAITSRSAMAAHIDFLREAGIDPALVTIGPLALAALLAPTKPTLLLEARDNGGLVIFDDGHITRLHGFGASGASELAREIAWAGAAFQNDETRDILLTGDDALCESLAKKIANPIRPLAEGLSGPAAAVPAEALRAFALASAAAESNPALPNFRNGAFAYHAPSEEAQRQLRRTLYIAAATLLILLGSWGVVVAERRAELSALRQDISRATRKIAPKAVPGTEVRRVRAKLEALEKRSAMLGGAGSASARTLDHLFAIHQAIPGEIPLEIVELTIDDTGIHFRGRTDTFESVDIVTRGLEALPAFAAARVQDVKSGVDGRIEFRATLAPEDR